jgi:hypothetical protein
MKPLRKQGLFFSRKKLQIQKKIQEKVADGKKGFYLCSRFVNKQIIKLVS